MLVYVLNINKQPLMPTSRFAKVRKLLKQGKAKVDKTVPFTIQLLYQTNDVIQDVTLGIDSGSKIVGVSATTTNKELYSGEFELRNDIVKLLSEKDNIVDIDVVEKQGIVNLDFLIVREKIIG